MTAFVLILIGVWVPEKFNIKATRWLFGWPWLFWSNHTLNFLLLYWGTPFEEVVSPVTGREYRSLDGRGNNVDNPDWGTEDVPLLRHTMPAAYYQNSEDGLDRT